MKGNVNFKYRSRKEFQQIGQQRVSELKQLKHRLEEQGIVVDESNEYKYLFIRNVLSATARVQSALYTRQAINKTGCSYIMSEMASILKKTKSIKWQSTQLYSIVGVRHYYAHDNYTSIDELYNTIKDCSEIIEYLILHADSNVNINESKIAVQVERDLNS